MKYTDWKLPTLNIKLTLSLNQLLYYLLKLTPREQVDLIIELYDSFDDKQKSEFERCIKERNQNDVQEMA